MFETLKLLLLVLLVTVSLSTRVYAADTHTVTPMVVEYELEQRQQTDTTVTITNTSDRILRIFPTVNEVKEGEGGVQAFLPAATVGTATSVTSWIKVTRARVEVPIGGKVEVPITVTAGLDAVPGSYYVFVGFGEGSKRDEVEAAALRGDVPGVMIRVNVADTKREYAALEGLSAKRFMLRPADRTITYTVNNLGDKPVTPTGEIIFYKQNGTEVASVPIVSEEIASTEKKTYMAAVPDTVGMGKYRALLEVSYGDRTLTDTIFLSIIPLWYILLAFLITLTLSILLTLWYHKKRKQRANFVEEEESLPLYVRAGHYRVEQHHDLDLKK